MLFRFGKPTETVANGRERSMIWEEGKAFWSDQCHGCQNCVFATPGYIRQGHEEWVDCRAIWDERTQSHASYLKGHSCPKHEYKANPATKIYKQAVGNVDAVLRAILG